MKRNRCDKLRLTAPLKPTSRNSRRGRRPRRTFLRMTNGMDLLLNATTRAVGRTVPGAPPLVDGRRQYHASSPPPRPLRRWSTGGAVFRASTLPTRRGLTDRLIEASHPTSPHPVGACFHAHPASIDGQLGFAATTPAATPQSRRVAPRQLPFQGSRGVGRSPRRLRICLPRC